MNLDGTSRNKECRRHGTTSKLALRSERIGFDLTLIAELNLNDIGGPRRRRWTHGPRHRLDQFERAGVGLTLLQFSPQAQEMERFARTVLPLLRTSARPGAGGHRIPLALESHNARYLR